MANRHIKARCSTLIVIREMQIQTTVRYHFINIKMPIQPLVKNQCVIFQAWPDRASGEWEWGSCPPHNRLRVKSVHHNLWRELQLRSQALLASHALHIFTFLALVPWLLCLFTWGLPSRSSSSTSAKTSLWKKREEILKSLLSTLIQYQSTLSPLPDLPATPESIKLWGPFICGSLNTEK